MKLVENGALEFLTKEISEMRERLLTVGYEMFSWQTQLRELRTLKFITQRQRGTTYLAVKLLEHFADSVLFCRSVTSAEHAKSLVGPCSLAKNILVVSTTDWYTGVERPRIVITDGVDPINYVALNKFIIRHCKDDFILVMLGQGV